MDRLRHIILVVVSIMAFISLSCSSASSAQSVENIKLIKISLEDGLAVVKDGKNDLKVVKVGDRLGDSGKIVEISDNRMVIEDMTDNGIETVIITITDGKQNIIRIKKTAGKSPVLYVPQQAK